MKVMGNDSASAQTGLATTAAAAAAARLRTLLDTVRALSGDDAYERYLSRHRALHPQLPALSPAEFYASEVERRYGGLTRCC